MKTIVEGVSIDLTPAQIKHIEKVKAQRLKELKSFEKVLLKFGFKKHNSRAGAFYDNDAKGWYAEIYDNSNYVWMTGKGLKDIGSFPGGYTYSSPKELIEELSKHEL